MGLELTLILAAGAVFLGTMCRAAVGFGDALIAMPLLLLWLEPTTATALMGLLGLVTAAAILRTGWRKVDWKSTVRFVTAAVCAVPLGIALLELAPARVVKVTLGLFVVCFAVYSLARVAVPTVARGRTWTYPLGMAAGALGAAYNFVGPPTVLYGTMQSWSPPQFRANLQGIFLPLGVAVVASHMVSGYWTGSFWWLALAAIPGFALGMVSGTFLSRRISPERFRPLVYGLLIVLGSLLVVVR